MPSESTSLDKLDYKILSQLLEDGRKSFTDIADELKVAISTVRNRYNKLVKSGALRIIGRTNPYKLGFQVYSRIDINVKPHNKIEKVIEELIEMPELTFLVTTSGKYSIEVSVACKDHNHFNELMNVRVSNIDGVDEMESTMYYQVRKWAQQEANVVNNILNGM
ncbi:MAG: AsnC family transcriptional regulator [Cytophagales bacterium]|nr:AsnC family transcriptional regulator [Cytophagales bacterium]